jgi:hypothetical protein
VLAARRALLRVARDPFVHPSAALFASAALEQSQVVCCPSGLADPQALNPVPPPSTCSPKTSNSLLHAGGLEDWVVACRCGVVDDDGEKMISCDACGVWMHSRCNGVEDADDPPPFVCEACGGGGGGGSGAE